MRTRISLMTGILSVLLLLPSSMFAQDDNCPAIVYYYDKSGQNVGQCSTIEGACKDMEYALKQGMSLCPTHVAVFYANPDNTYQQLDWQPPPASREIESTLWAIGRWIGPAIGLILGWVAAWAWTRRRQGGVA